MSAPSIAARRLKPMKNALSGREERTSTKLVVDARTDRTANRLSPVMRYDGANPHQHLTVSSPRSLSSSAPRCHRRDRP
jgi:hypothetical protein